MRELQCNDDVGNTGSDDYERKFDVKIENFQDW